MLDIVEECEHLLPLHGRLTALRRLALDEYILDGLDLQLSFFFVVPVPQLQPLLRDLAIGILELGYVSWHDVFGVDGEQLAYGEGLITHQSNSRHALRLLRHLAALEHELLSKWRNVKLFVFGSHFFEIVLFYFKANIIVEKNKTRI